MSDYKNAGAIVRRAQFLEGSRGPVPTSPLHPADVFHRVLADHGAETARRVRASMEFLNGGPIDVTSK